MFVIDVDHRVDTTQRTHAVCVKFHNDAHTREVSIAADDSCESMKYIGRCEIRCYQCHDEEDVRATGMDVTANVFGEVWNSVPATIDNVQKALSWLKHGPGY